MADMTDAGNGLVSLIAYILYPQGTAAPSVTGDRVLVYQGWPDPVTLASDLAAGTIHVSVFPTKSEKVTSVSQDDEDWEEISNDGATGTAVLELRRQTRLFQIGIWAGMYARRDAVATVVDAGLAGMSRMTLADGSAAVMTYASSVQDDDQQQAGIYRRELMYAVNYATILTMTEYAIVVNAINVTAGSSAQSGPTFSLPLPPVGPVLPASLIPTPTPTPPPIIITPPIGSLPAITYDQGFGATDTNGLVAALPFTPGTTAALQVWLNTAAGLSTYNGLSPYPGFQMNGTGANFQVGATGPGAKNAAFGPMVDLVTALNLLPTSYGMSYGIPNQLFCAEAQTYLLNGKVQNLWEYLGSASVTPACFQSYDPADPLNLATHGRAGTAGRGARPVWALGATDFTGSPNWPGNGRGDGRDYGGWAFRGMEFQSRGPISSFGFAYCQNNMLFENNSFNGVGLTLENSNPVPGYNLGYNNIIRKNAIFGQYSNTGHAQGLFGSATNFTLEDNVFWHCGWFNTGDDTVDRSADPSVGGPTIYNHCVYIDGDPTNTILLTARRNVMIDGSASGLSLRGSHLVHHNIIVDCPTPEFKGGGSNSDTDSPLGDIQKSYCQLVVGGADINPANPRMQGFSAENGRPAPDSYCNNSLYINSPGYGKINNQWLRLTNTVPTQPSFMAFNSNRAYAFAPPAARLSITPGAGGLATAITYVDNDNVLSETSPMTNDQLYAAVGYADKAAMITDMLADPTQPWAYRLLGAAASGFNFNFDFTYV